MEDKDIKDEEIEECCEHDHEHEHEHHHHHDEECCGHDHEHEHHHHHHDDDDEECCGHDHEHEHHHHHDDDDDECCCHDHEHHHHDDDDDEECCGHDHEHEHHHHHHDHGHKYDVPGFKLFETHNHEGATICSFEKDSKHSADEAIPSMESAIKTLEKWLDDTDAMIGHVKGYIKEAGPTTTFSTVGYGLNIEKHESNSVCVGFASIVFGPTEEELMKKVQEVFAEV